MKLQQGALETLYYYLWYPNEQIKHINLDFHLPDTIIYRLGVIQAWYFTSIFKEIQVKKIENRTIANIEKTFLKDAKHDVVAYFISCSHQRDFYNTHEKRCDFLKDQLNIDCTTSILYLNKNNFLEFINQSDIHRNGILQRFVPPPIEHETVIQAIWSSNILILSQRVNHRYLDNDRFDVQEKCATFNSTDIFSRAQPIKSQQQTQAIKKLIQHCVEKIRVVTYDKNVVNRLVLYCKFDQQNQLNLLYCTNIRNNDEYPFPVRFGLKYRPDNIKNQVTTNTLKPIQMLMDVQCILCSQLCQTEDLHEIHYKDLIQPNKTYRMEIKPFSTKILKSDSTSEDFVQDYVANTTKLIPDIFKKLYPNLTHKKYLELKQNEAFLRTITYVCSTCYTDLNKPKTKSICIKPIGKSRSITDLINQLKTQKSYQNLEFQYIPLTQRELPREEFKISPLRLRSTRVQSGYASNDSKKRIFSSTRTSSQRRFSMETTELI